MGLEPAMNISDIRAVALHQHLRQVEAVEVRDGRDHVRIVIRSRAAAAAAAADGDSAPRSSAPVVHCEAAPPSGLTVKAESLGILRRSHPSRSPTQVEAGDAVVAGQPLALLQVRDAYTTVVAPCDGVIEDVLAGDGERIDYGRPLFTLRPAAR